MFIKKNLLEFVKYHIANMFYFFFLMRYFGDMSLMYTKLNCVRPISNVLYDKIVLKIYSLKIFRFFYRSFVRKITISRNIKRKSIQQLIQTNQNYKRTETLKSSKVYFIKKNKLKIVCKIICAQKQSSKGVVQERYSANVKETHKGTIMQKCDLNKAALQLC